VRAEIKPIPTGGETRKTGASEGNIAEGRIGAAKGTDEWGGREEGQVKKMKS